MLKILSLGAGVQSSVILMRAELGETDTLDGAIFADTGWESAATYQHLAWLRNKCSRVPIHVIRRSKIREGMLAWYRGEERLDGCFATVPFYLKQPDGGVGLMPRQCTSCYKVQPITLKLRGLCGLKRYARSAGVMVKLVIGISWDERVRMRDSETPWIENSYPLIEEHRTRTWCEQWWRAHFGRKQPLPRSACLGCTFRANGEWKRMKEKSPAEFASVVQFERDIQAANAVAPEGRRLRGVPYLHKSLQPLSTIFFGGADAGGFEGECSGLCGV